MVMLRFATFGSALRFVRFCNLYYNESGAGNGYGAYWGARLGIPFLPIARMQETLDDECLSYTAQRIASVRPVQDVKKYFQWHRQKEGFFRGIVFSSEVFPPTTSPKRGDMYRIPRSHMSSDYRELAYSEGRVVSENGAFLQVRGAHDDCELRRGKGQSYQLHTIPRNKVIWIPDWVDYITRSDTGVGSAEVS